MLVALLAACTSSVDTAAKGSSLHSSATAGARSPAPSAADRRYLGDHPCLVGRGATLTSVPDNRSTLAFATLGDGPHAVVLSNQSDEDLCSWIGFAATLQRDGFRVVLYDYALTPDLDLPLIARYLRRHGARSIALVGASIGGMGTIMTAAKLRPRPDAIVTLSAEFLYNGTYIAPFAARVTSPVLFVAARMDDGPLSHPTTPHFLRVCPAKVKKADIVPGSAHGTALLRNPAIVAEVVHFLNLHDA